MELFKYFILVKDYDGIVISGYKQGIHWNFINLTSDIYLDDKITGPCCIYNLNGQLWYVDNYLCNSDNILSIMYHDRLVWFIINRLNNLSYNWEVDRISLRIYPL